MINFRKIVTLFTIVTVVVTMSFGIAENVIAANATTAENTNSKTNNSTDELVNKLENRDAYDKVIKKKIVIKKKVITRRTSTLPVGCKRVVQKGKNGLMIKMIKKTFSTKTNELISTKQSKKVVRKTKNRIVLTGTRQVVSKINRGAKRLDNVKKKIVMSATAYTHTGNRTASGRVAKVGHVAVDPRVIPLGTLLYIKSNDGGPDYGFCIAADTGGAIKGKRVDLFFYTRRECINFGRRKVTVLVLGKA